MEVLVFDLIGKMAHFRKYYTNSSSLSYYFPPRTTIMGIIAGIIGLERDSYYEIFSEEKCRISVAIKAPLRKKMSTVNYVLAESIKQVNLSAKQHTQIPLEIILPEDYSKSIIYRIFFHHEDYKIFDKAKEMITQGKVCFPPYLGLSEFIGNIEYVYLGEIEERKIENGEITSVVSIDYLRNNQCSIQPLEGALYIKELMPFSFDSNRTLRNSPKEFIGEIKLGKLQIEGGCKVYTIEKIGERIVFMEE